MRSFCLHLLLLRLRRRTLGSNLLDSGGFPSSLCAFACAAQKPPFLCPASHDCAVLPGLANCSAQCEYPACPASNLTADTFAFASTACAKAMPQDSCLGCLPAIMSVFLLPPLDISDSVQLIACLVASTPALLEAGADPYALAMISNCAMMYGFAWNNDDCKVSLPSSAFASLQSSCASPATACSGCVSDIAAIFRGAGVDVSADPSSAQYNMLGACTDVHVSRMLAAGADAMTLSQFPSCAALSGYGIVSVLDYAAQLRDGRDKQHKRSFGFQD
jgi:hypothetical protein